MICVRESYASYGHVYETEVVRRWHNLPVGVQLPLINGASCQLIFSGRRGSSSGPDIHDAILYFSSSDRRCVGDVEFHVRASDWYTHQHHTDPRYNNVMLHVVLLWDETRSIIRQDGIHIPTCSLNDLPSFITSTSQAVWPCQALATSGNLDTRLRQAGLLRFEQKTHAFVELLRNVEPLETFSAYDVALITALAEGLGYGRDRGFFQAAGRYLLGLPVTIPEPLGHRMQPAPLDASRLFSLRRLISSWRSTGVWQPLHTILLSDLPATDSIERLRAFFSVWGTARADILITNIILPMAAAIALIEQKEQLARRAQELYTQYPRLSSNRITRAMSTLLQLKREPSTACQQQGLHYLYQQTCREKLCEVCMMGRCVL